MLEVKPGYQSHSSYYSFVDFVFDVLFGFWLSR